MRTADSDVVVFQSEAFSLDCPVEDGVAYDLPLGDDLAADLCERLIARYPEVVLRGPPDREDWGSVVYVESPGPYWLNVHWVPLNDGRSDTWSIQFMPVRGPMSALFSRAPRASASCAPLMNMVAAVLAADPEVFRNVRWLTDEEFSAEY